MKGIILLSLMAGLFGAGDEPKADEAKKELEKFQGNWTFTKIERDGEDLTNQVGDAELEIKGEKYTAPSIAASFKLDSSKSPKAIDLSYTEGPSAGKTIKAIYKVEGDVLTICRGLSEDDKRPEEFTAPSGSGRMLFVLKRK